MRNKIILGSANFDQIYGIKKNFIKKSEIKKLFDLALKNEIKIIDTSPIYKESEKVDLSSMIDDAKNTCKELDFEEGTEKFSDCALKLYSQSVELAAKSKQQIVMQPQSSGSNSVTIYDPVRDSKDLIKKGQDMISGKCTLGIDC